MDELTVLREFRDAVPVARDAARERALGFRGRRRRRLAVFSAAVVGAVALVTSAFAFDLLPGSPAPDALKHNLSFLVKPPRGAILGLRMPSGPRLFVERTRLLTSLMTARHRYLVWVTPRADGQRCAFVQETRTRTLAGFGCSTGAQELSPTTILGAVTLIGGFAPPRATTVEVHGAPASSKTFRVERGFFFGKAPGLLVLQAIAKDAHGRVLARWRPAPAGLPPEPPITRTERKALTITTRSGRKISLVVGPGEGGTCVTWAGDAPFAGQADCGPFVERGLRASTVQLRPAGTSFVFVQGETGPHIRAIRLRFEDGSTVPVKLGLRVFLYEVQPRNYVKGHRPQIVVGLDDEGHVIASQRLGPYAG
jgi:hypothetical protein